MCGEQALREVEAEQARIQQECVERLRKEEAETAAFRSKFRDMASVNAALLHHRSALRSYVDGDVAMIHIHLVKLGIQNHSKCRNHLVNLYAKCRVFGSVHKVLNKSPELDLVGWSALISGYAQNGYGDEAIMGFREMHGLGIKCNEFTFPSVLKACAMKKDIVGGKLIHGIVVVTGFEKDVFVANTLVVVYAKCGEFLDSRRLFDETRDRNIVSWNALFSSYTQGDFYNEAIGLFGDMVSVITGTFMLQNSAVDQHQRGAANGISMTLQSICKAIGPACGGAILSWSQKRLNAAILPVSRDMENDVGKKMMLVIVDFVYLLESVKRPNDIFHIECNRGNWNSDDIQTIFDLKSLLVGSILIKIDPTIHTCKRYLFLFIFM
ncbi:Pentatricopeptide repeat-containing protein [Artemisia annua]|uniref:Pentatricopeptide repeat-containing protein n=1 Tax=Artemisia annua TaxID=35608 RepID=A0A2U1Q6F3_ARTAN|nr:Pentatricopeptide repeat-containing protein [Artemisia annua]